MVEVDGTGGAAGAVVVGVDGSAGSRTACAVAAAEARRRGARLLVVHAVPRPGARDPWAVAAPTLRERAEGLLESARADAESGGGLDVETAQWVGRPASLLVEATGPGDLLVVGRRRSADHPGRWGSVSLAVASRARCPVVVVPADHEPTRVTGRVLVGLDGTARSLPALAVAADEAERRGAELVAVHCWDEMLIDVPESAELAELWRQPSERAVAEELAGFGEDHPDVPLRTELVHDRAASGLLRAAADADLVVLGVRGGGGVAGLPVGSVALAVAGAATCPVELVRRGPRTAVQGRRAKGQHTLYEDAAASRR